MILFVIDSVATYPQEKELFESNGYHVALVSSEAEAIAVLNQTDAVRLIIFDIRLDIKIIRNILSERSLPVVLFITNDSQHIADVDVIKVYGILPQHAPDFVALAILKNAIIQFKAYQQVLKQLAFPPNVTEILTKSNRLLRSVYQINQILLAYSTDDSVMTAICNVLVDDGSFKMAWIGLVDEQSRVVPKAVVGDTFNYVRNIQVYADDRPEGRGPIGIAIRTRKAAVVQDAMNDPRLTLWAAQRTKTSWNSSIAVPFRLYHKTDGVLVVYSHEVNFFSETEIAMLKTIASNFQLATERIAAERETKHQLVQKTALLKEVHHRTKNNIVAIESLLFLQIQKCTDEPAVEILHDAINRVKSMRSLYEHLLVSDDFSNILVKDYVTSLIEKVSLFILDPARIDIRFQIDEFSLDSKRVFSLGIIINELLTNAAKYAFNGLATGNVFIQIVQQADKIIVSVHDDGVGLPHDFSIEKSKGSGLMLVNMLTQELKGELYIDRPDSTPGTRVIIKFPIGL